MRIGYFIPGWPPGAVPNGIVTTLGNLGRQLRELGHQVFYITPHCDPQNLDQWITVLGPIRARTFVQRLQFKFRFESAFFDAVSNRIADAVQHLIQSHGLDIFQMEETHGWARTVIQRSPIPVVVRLHGPWFLTCPHVAHAELHKPENRHRLAREGNAIHLAAALVAPSKFVLDRADEYYGPLNNATQVIPNMVAVRPEPERWTIERCDRNLILFVGRFDYLKGADVLLRAFSKLAWERPALKLLFIGPDVGLDSETGARVGFAEFVNRELAGPIRERIDYRGFLPHHDIQKLRSRACVTVVCSRFENFPNTVMEGMAAGSPTVATDTGGIPELLIDGRNGLLAPVDDVDGLASAIARLLDDPSLAIKLGEQAARDCSDWFSPPTIAQRTLDLYANTISAHKFSSTKLVS